MTGKREKGFTLVELLVVVSIIALLVSILLPALGQAKELVKRSMCMSNAGAIGKTMITYAMDFDNAFPAVAIWGTGAGVSCTDKVGNQRDAGIYEGQDRSNTINLWLLCHEDYTSTAMFICPSTSHAADSSTVADFSDFTARENVSYGFQVPYNSRSSATGFGPGSASVNMSSKVAIMADSSPYMNTDGSWNLGATITDWGSDPSEAQREAGNSPNHGGKGQSVLYSDSHVEFADRADVGIDGDNIYTAAAGTDETDPAGALNVPNSEQDSMIAP